MPTDHEAERASQLHQPKGDPMRLVKGAGAPGKGACWMSAIHAYAVNGASWSDHPECVDPVIRTLCIRLNDWCDDGEREELIGPHLFAPVGTAGDPELSVRRAYRCSDVAVRRWAPRALRARGRADLAARLETLSEIADKATAICARNGARAVRTAAYDAAAYTAAACDDAACDDAAAAYAVAYAVADAATAAAYAAAYTAVADAATKRDLLSLILELCAMGERKEIVGARPFECVVAEVCR